MTGRLEIRPARGLFGAMGFDLVDVRPGGAEHLLGTYALKRDAQKQLKRLERERQALELGQAPRARRGPPTWATRGRSR